MKNILASLWSFFRVRRADRTAPRNRTREEQAAVNQTIFALFEKNGASEEKEYAFDQIFTSESRDRLELLREVLWRDGWMADTIEEYMEPRPRNYYVDAYKRLRYRRETLESESMGMLSLASTHGVFYDGWGVEIVKEEPNQRPERNAGATSSSTSTPPAGVAHP